MAVARHDDSANEDNDADDTELPELTAAQMPDDGQLSKREEPYN